MFKLSLFLAFMLSSQFASANPYWRVSSLFDSGVRPVQEDVVEQVWVGRCFERHSSKVYGAAIHVGQFSDSNVGPIADTFYEVKFASSHDPFFFDEVATVEDFKSFIEYDLAPSSTLNSYPFELGFGYNRLRVSYNEGYLVQRNISRGYHCYYFIKNGQSL